MTQKPHGPSDLYCPQWKKPMSKVCHTCPWWIKVVGTNPNSANPLSPEQIDRWDCAIAWGPMLTINTSREAHNTAAQVQEMRNEAAQNNAQQAENMARLSDNLITMHGQNTQLAIAQIRAGVRPEGDVLPPPQKPRLIAGGSDG